jgi:subtilase family serine protease
MIPKPSWQSDRGCNNRAVADVAAVADPYTGVAVLDTTGSGGWTIFGGTSVGAPIIASVYALAGNSASLTYGSYSYAHTSSLFDVTSGSNGGCRRNAAYLCTGVSGYDGPTGNGTPNGIGAF